MCPWPGPAQRRGRGVSDGGGPPVGGRLRQSDRTPFFRLTPAFGLRSLRKNGYVLTGVDGTGPPTGDRPRRETAAGWRRAKSDESATARSALDKGTSAHARARGSSAAGPGAKRCSPGGEGERNREAAAGPECDNAVLDRKRSRGRRRAGAGAAEPEGGEKNVVALAPRRRRAAETRERWIEREKE